jgi:hypothetical protein
MNLFARYPGQHLPLQIIEFILLFTMSPPTSVNPAGPAKNLRSSENLRSHVTSRGGVRHTNPSPSTAPTPQLPRDGASLCPPDHRTTARASTTTDSVYHTVTGRNTTPVHLATIAQSDAPPSTNAFADLARTDEDSTTDDRTPDAEFTDTELSEHGDSHTLLDELTQLADPLIDGPSHAGEPIVAAFNAHDRNMTLAITQFADSIDNLDSSGTPPATMDPMMLMLHTMQNTNQAILACLNRIDANIKSHNAALNDKANLSEIARLDQRLTEMTQSV